MYAATNLLNNPTSRSLFFDEHPMTSSGSFDTSIESCYRAPFSDTPGTIKVTFDLGSFYVVHAVVAVQGLAKNDSNYNKTPATDNPAYYSYKIYVTG